MAAQQREIANRVDEASRQLEAAAILWRLKKDPVHLKEAFKRGDQLAALSPNGPTSYANQDQATRQIALSLVKAADLLAGDLDAEPQGGMAEDRERARQRDGQGPAADGGRLDQHPFDSHGNTLLGYMALMSTLALGDVPDAQKWFDFSFRAMPPPRAVVGAGGRLRQRHRLRQYAAGYMLALWDPIRQATGVNLYAKPWTVGFMDFLIEFVPPGAPCMPSATVPRPGPISGCCGLLRSRVATPRAAWYVDKLAAIEDALSGSRRRIQCP
jgi:hypothetical protein